MKSDRIGNASDSSQANRWMELATRYLAARDRTGAQLRRYLLNKGASQDQADRVVVRLSDLRYLDDRAYAERWIAGRLARRPMGRDRLKCELEAKGVAASVAEEAIRHVVRETDDVTLARRVLDTAQRGGRRMTAIQTVRLLRQRGFDEDTIGRLIGDCI